MKKRTLSKPSRLVSIRDAEEEYGLSGWTLRRLVADGALPAVIPPGGRRHILLERADLETAIERWKERAAVAFEERDRDEQGRFRGQSGDSDAKNTH